MRNRQRHRQREKQAPCGEPNVGLNPSTLGSEPELKTDAQLLSVRALFSFKDFIYLKEREHEQGRGAEREGEADSLLSREPDARLYPRILGS